MKKWFTYDPEGDGYQEHPTEEAAISSAEKSIREYLDDGWAEDVEFVTVGKVTHRATQCDYTKRPPDSEIDEEGLDGEGTWWDGDWEEMCNYKMQKA